MQKLEYPEVICELDSGVFNELPREVDELLRQPKRDDIEGHDFAHLFNLIAGEADFDLDAVETGGIMVLCSQIEPSQCQDDFLNSWVNVYGTGLHVSSNAPISILVGDISATEELTGSVRPKHEADDDSYFRKVAGMARQVDDVALETMGFEIVQPEPLQLVRTIANAIVRLPTNTTNAPVYNQYLHMYSV